MKYYADLHIHSRFSRATSKDLTVEQLFLWAQRKGIQLVGTGDCVHPGWFAEIQKKLEPAEPGFFALKPSFARAVAAQVPAACVGDVRFVLSTEISNIYKKNDTVRKVHNVVCAPSIAAVEKMRCALGAIGNISFDGRPILGLDSRDLLEIVLESDTKAFLIPAHIWTPWFSVLGSKSGFDRIDECYGDLAEHVFAVETGLSSDPAMNWRLTQLDRYALVSSSDAHSPAKLGREATVFDTDLSYEAMYRALSDPTDTGLLGTIEFFPEEGKYHVDGHRECQVRLTPQETRKNKGLCPSCGKPVTVGVMARVEELADRPEGEKPSRAKPFVRCIPLAEVIAQARGVASPTGKQVDRVYQGLLERLGNELYILQDAPLNDIEAVAGDLVAEGVRRMRTGKVLIAAGYDGEYGTVHLFSDEERG